MKRIFIRFVIAVAISAIYLAALICLSLFAPEYREYVPSVALGLLITTWSTAIAEWIYGDKALKYEPQGK